MVLFSFSIPLKHVWLAKGQRHHTIFGVFVLSHLGSEEYLSPKQTFHSLPSMLFVLLFFCCCCCCFVVWAEFVGKSYKDVWVLKLININRSLTREVKEGGTERGQCGWAWTESGREKEEEEGGESMAGGKKLGKKDKRQRTTCKLEVNSSKEWKTEKEIEKYKNE